MKIKFIEYDKSVDRKIICEDFGRLHQLKCVAPQQIQAKREPNRLEQIIFLSRAVFQNY